MDISLFRCIFTSTYLRNTIFHVYLPYDSVTRSKINVKKRKEIIDSQSLVEYIRYGLKDFKSFHHLLDTHYNIDKCFREGFKDNKDITSLATGENQLMAHYYKKQFITEYTLFNLLIMAALNNQIGLFKELIGYAQKHNLPISYGKTKRLHGKVINIEMLDLLTQYQSLLEIEEIESDYEWSTFDHNSEVVQRIVGYGIKNEWTIKISHFNTTIDTMKWICESGIRIVSLENAFKYEASIGRLEGLDYLSKHINQDNYLLDSLFTNQLYPTKESLEYIITFIPKANCTYELMYDVINTKDDQLIEYVLDHLDLFQERLENETTDPTFKWEVSSIPRIYGLSPKSLRKITRSDKIQFTHLFTNIILQNDLELFKEFCNLHLVSMDNSDISRLHEQIILDQKLDFAEYIIVNYPNSIPKEIKICFNNGNSVEKHMEIINLYFPFWGTDKRVGNIQLFWSPVPVIKLLIEKKIVSTDQLKGKLLEFMPREMMFETFVFLDEMVELNYNYFPHLFHKLNVSNNLQIYQYVWEKYPVIRPDPSHPINLLGINNIEVVKFLWEKYYLINKENWVLVDQLVMSKNIEIMSWVCNATPELLFNNLLDPFTTKSKVNSLEFLKLYLPRIPDNTRSNVYKHCINLYQTSPVTFYDQLQYTIDYHQQNNLSMEELSSKDLVDCHSASLRYGQTKLQSYFQSKF